LPVEIILPSFHFRTRKPSSRAAPILILPLFPCPAGFGGPAMEIPDTLRGYGLGFTWDPGEGAMKSNTSTMQSKALAALAPMLLCLALAAAPEAASFRNPLNPGPDPFLTYHQGNYYLATTQGNAVRIWKSRTLGGLKTAQPVTVWSDTTPSRCCHIWAAEFHLLAGPAGTRWYLYYTADDGTDSHHRMYVLESAGSDPLGPYAFKGKLATDPKDEFYAIDGSVLRKGKGELYFLWAGHPGHRLFIARLANPWTTTGTRILIPADGFGCEEVREGPFALVRNGRTFLTYSACDTGKPDYKLGMVVADESADVLDAKSWLQHPAPIFQRSDANGVYGPGHHSFFKSPDGNEDWIAYHGKTSSAFTYAGRETRAQRFSWKPDGAPDFGIPLPLGADVDAPGGDGTDGVGLAPASRNGPLGFSGLPKLHIDALGRMVWNDGKPEKGEKEKPRWPGVFPVLNRCLP
jgi:GH43 family beta-xylosidase